MAKFSDLDPECKRRLVVILRCLHVAEGALAEKTETSVELMRLMLLKFTHAEVDSLSDSDIEEFVKELD